MPDKSFKLFSSAKGRIELTDALIRGYRVIDLNYSTNLVKSEVAVQVKDTLKAIT